MIAMSSPDITQAEIDAVNEVLRTPNLSIGPKIKAFETALANYVGARHAVHPPSIREPAAFTCASSRRASMMATKSSRPHSASSPRPYSIVYERGTPVFVDTDPMTGNIDPRQIEAAITDRTRAIMPVHAFGQPADMAPILDIAAKHRLYVIEDACEAIGAEYKGLRGRRDDG